MAFWLLLLMSMAAFCLNLIVDINGTVFIGGDHIWFQPVVFSVAKTGVLAHEFLSPISTNPNSPMIWHGWLMPAVTGRLQQLLLPNGSIMQAKLASDVVAMIVFCTFVFVFKSKFS